MLKLLKINQIKYKRNKETDISKDNFTPFMIFGRKIRNSKARENEQ